jgi:hypothetical protein
MIGGPVGIWIKIRLNPDLQACLDHHFLSGSHGPLRTPLQNEDYVLMGAEGLNREKPSRLRYNATKRLVRRNSRRI